MPRRFRHRRGGSRALPRRVGIVLASTSSCADEPFDFRRRARRAAPTRTPSSARLTPPDARYLVFAPNQYGLGNRLRAMKSALLVAMLPAASSACAGRTRGRSPTLCSTSGSTGGCPTAAATATTIRRCSCPSPPTAALPRAARRTWACRRRPTSTRSTPARTLEVRVFTDLYIYLQANPYYASALAAFDAECPNRMGCVLCILPAAAGAARAARRAPAAAGLLCRPGAQPAVAAGGDQAARRMRLRASAASGVGCRSTPTSSSPPTRMSSTCTRASCGASALRSRAAASTRHGRRAPR